MPADGAMLDQESLVLASTAADSQRQTSFLLRSHWRWHASSNLLVGCMCTISLAAAPRKVRIGHLGIRCFTFISPLTVTSRSKLPKASRKIPLAASTRKTSSLKQYCSHLRSRVSSAYHNFPNGCPVFGVGRVLPERHAMLSDPVK